LESLVTSLFEPAIGTETSLNIRGTKPIPETGMLRGIAFIDPETQIYGFFFISIVVLELDTGSC
jgi:hypothetical protein